MAITGDLHPSLPRCYFRSVQGGNVVGARLTDQSVASPTPMAPTKMRVASTYGNWWLPGLHMYEGEYPRLINELLSGRRGAGLRCGLGGMPWRPAVLQSTGAIHFLRGKDNQRLRSFAELLWQSACQITKFLNDWASISIPLRVSL